MTWEARTFTERKEDAATGAYQDGNEPDGEGGA
jgi:hypothetical protein